MDVKIDAASTATDACEVDVAQPERQPRPDDEEPLVGRVGHETQHGLEQV